MSTARDDGTREGFEVEAVPVYAMGSAQLPDGGRGVLAWLRLPADHAVRSFIESYGEQDLGGLVDTFWQAMGVHGAGLSRVRLNLTWLERKPHPFTLSLTFGLGSFEENLTELTETGILCLYVGEEAPGDDVKALPLPVETTDLRSFLGTPRIGLNRRRHDA
jgi:hypothetical protein